jgi:hypothetical protein
MIGALSNRLQSRSVALVRHLTINLRGIVSVWVVIASFACGLRLAFPATPVNTNAGQLAAFLPYLLVVGAPVSSLFLALRWFPSGTLLAQPEIRLARYGRWKTLDCVTTRSMPGFGASGIMASLLLGMLINIPVRTIEFIMAIPALGGQPPAWFQSLYAAMLIDVVLLTSLYAVAFVMALRHVPLFPRFLLLVWGVDVVAQLAIASHVVAAGGAPADVTRALQDLLTGNLKKVLVSAALWLPYLLLSKRVNLTYRQRVRAQGLNP